jgi:prepilin-type N-terminal cleavage/methylation domain-containing protein
MAGVVRYKYMDIKKTGRSSNRGFTIVEVLTVVVIIGILIAIGVPRLLDAQDRAKYANLKMNMTMLRTGIEVYSLDWAGRYPATRSELYNEGKSKKYLRDITNPFNNNPDSVKDISEITSTAVFAPGTLAYGGSGSGINPLFPFFTPPDQSTYAIYASDKDSDPLQVSSQIFYLSNGK